MGPRGDDEAVTDGLTTCLECGVQWAGDTPPGSCPGQALGRCSTCEEAWRQYRLASERGEHPMQITITALHPAGFPVQIALTEEENETLHDIVDRLLARGYRPPAAEWQRTPDGLPICPRHQAVMVTREKQGDCWHSHRLVTSDGIELWCRGFAHGEKDADGYWH